MFLAGLEIDLAQMLGSGRAAVLAGTLGVAGPLLLGSASALPFGYAPATALFIGVILTATSVSISAQTLMELDALKTRVGMALLGAAVVDDVLGILVLSVFIALAGGAAAGAAGVLWVIIRMAAFLFASVVVGIRILPRLAERVQHLPVIEGLLAFVVAAMLLFSWSAEALGGVAAITGSFIAGAGLAQSRGAVRHRIAQGVRPLAYGFFVPLFFVGIGLETNAREISLNLLPFVGLVLLAAIISKVVGCGVAGLLGGFDRREALQLGVGMISRGEVGLVIASVGLERGVIGAEIFAVTVIVVLVTTLITPVMLKGLFSG
jgi:Kef-type K+ transport system membrane component KefB